MDTIQYLESLGPAMMAYTGIAMVLYALAWPVLIAYIGLAAIVALFAGRRGLQWLVILTMGSVVYIGYIAQAQAGETVIYDSMRDCQRLSPEPWTCRFVQAPPQVIYVEPAPVYPTYIYQPRPCYETSVRLSSGAGFSTSGCY